MTAQSGGKAPRFDRADPRVWGYALWSCIFPAGKQPSAAPCFSGYNAYTSAELLEECVGKIGIKDVKGLFLYATLTAQSGGKAPRFDRADPRVRGYAPPYNPAELLEKCEGKISLSAI